MGGGEEGGERGEREGEGRGKGERGDRPTAAPARRRVRDDILERPSRWLV